MEDIYRDKFGTFTDVKSLGWGSVESQQKRFKAILDIRGIDTKSHSVLDVGCGYGDLAAYIVNYTGIDIRASAILRAKSIREGDFQTLTVFEVSGQYDWVVASGLFAFDQPNWTAETRKTVEKMFDICRYGVAFNLLSNLSKFRRDPDMKYVTIEEIMQWIPSISQKFEIRHDYLLNDMTVYLYKK